MGGVGRGVREGGRGGEGREGDGMGGEGMGGEGGSAHPCVVINPLDGERDSGLQLCVLPSPFTGLSHRLLQGVKISITAVLD